MVKPSECETEVWENEGLLVVKEALDSDLLNRLRRVVDNLYQQFLSGSISNYSLDSETATIMPDLWKKSLALDRENQSFRRWNIVTDAPDFVALIDHRKIFERVIGIMGADIQLFKSQVIVVPPSIMEEPYLHTDAGGLGLVRSADGQPPLMLSIQYFLTDLLEPNMGNFTYVPGSDKKDFPPDDENPSGNQVGGYVQGRDILGRVQLQAKAGDAVIFPHSLWHGISRNISEVSRRSLIYSYAKLFIRPYDYEHQPESVLNTCTARQRRLLGEFGGWYWRPGCLLHSAPDQENIIRQGI